MRVKEIDWSRGRKDRLYELGCIWSDMTKIPIFIHLNSHLQVDRKLYNMDKMVYFILSVLITIKTFLKMSRDVNIIANCKVFYVIVIISRLGGHGKLHVRHINFEIPLRPSSKYIPEKRKKKYYGKHGKPVKMQIIIFKICDSEGTIFSNLYK